MSKNKPSQRPKLTDAQKKIVAREADKRLQLLRRLKRAQELVGKSKKTLGPLKEKRMEANRNKYTTVTKGSEGESIHAIDFKGDAKKEIQIKLGNLFNCDHIFVAFGERNKFHKGTCYAERRRNGQYYDLKTGERVKIYTGDTVMEDKAFLGSMKSEYLVLKQKSDKRRLAQKKGRTKSLALAKRKKLAEVKNKKKMGSLKRAIERLRKENIPEEGILALRMMVTDREIGNLVTTLLADKPDINPKKNHRDLLKIHNYLSNASDKYFSVKYATEVTKLETQMEFKKRLKGEALAAYKQRNNPRVKKIIDKMKKELKVGPESTRFWSYLHERLTDPSGNNYYKAYAEQFRTQRPDRRATEKLNRTAIASRERPKR